MVDYALVGTVTLRRLAVVAVAGAGALLGLAPAASAHAVLWRTSPTAGQVLAAPPAAVTLAFTEPVQVEPDGIRVYDPELHRVDRHDVARATGAANAVSVRLAAGLSRGTYTVAWRVVSIDSHPATGTFTFSVVAAGPVAGTVRTAGPGRGVGLALGVARFASYAGLAAGPGALLTVLLLWSAGRNDRRARRLVRGGLALLLAGTVAAYLLEGPYAAGVGLSRVFSAVALQTVYHSHYGHVLLVRLYLVAALAGFAALAAGRRSVRLDVLTLAAAAAVLPTFGLAGHAAAGGGAGLAVAVDSVHVAAMAVWLGGLAVLATSAFPGGGLMAGLVARRFSRLALGCVLALAATGVAQAVRQTGAWAALTATDYGRLVVVKAAGLAVLAALGYLARRRLARGRDLGRGVATEVAVGAAVLVATSVLVATVPARTAYAAPVVRRLQIADLRLDVRVAPPRVGVPLTVRVRGRSAGLTGRFTLPGSGLAPLPLAFAGGAGTATLPAPGRWVLELTVLAVSGRSVTIATTIPVR